MLEVETIVNFSSEMTMTKGLQLLEPHSFMGSNWRNDDGGSFRFDENSRRLLQSFRFRCVVIVKFQNGVRCVSVCLCARFFSFFIIVCIFDGLETAIEKLHFTFHTNVYLIFIVLYSGCMVER